MVNTVVILKYDDLVSFDPLKPNQTLVDRIQEAFGPDGLGILAVEGVPEFEALRQNLLPLSAKLPSLPEVTESCVDEKSAYTTGWSHGREQLAPGKPDHAKGSYYGNPLTEDLVPALTARGTHDEPYWQAQAAANPSFYAPNLWPTQTLPALQGAFLAMGQALAATGRLVAAVCDTYCQQHGVDGTGFAEMLTQSLNAKGRLLHYFETMEPRNDSSDESMWCSWHNDHGSLTGLVPAMYMNSMGEQIDCPDQTAGLYIQSRSGDMVHVRIPALACAFQIGETSQIQSGGLLQATPHAVRSSTVPGVTRESFAVFLEPEFDALLSIPPNKTLADCTVSNAIASLVPLESRWKPGQTFGDFCAATVAAFLNKED